MNARAGERARAKGEAQAAALSEAARGADTPRPAATKAVPGSIVLFLRIVVLFYYCLLCVVPGSIATLTIGSTLVTSASWH